MQFRGLIAAIILLLPIKVKAQNNIRAYEAKDSVGKRVSVMAHVVSVTENTKTRLVHIG